MQCRRTYKPCVCRWNESRQRTWSDDGIDKKSRLRVFVSNSGKIYEELIKRKKVNTKLNELYEELNNRVSNILPINNEDVMEECRQYEPEYINETKLYIDPINNYVIGVQVAGDFRFRNFAGLNHFMNLCMDRPSSRFL